MGKRKQTKGRFFCWISSRSAYTKRNIKNTDINLEEAYTLIEKITHVTPKK